MPRIWIKNGKIWDGEKYFFADLCIENGKIAKISKMVNPDADLIYDAEGQIVLPGLIDSHLHMQKMSSDSLGVGDWACFPFGVTCAVDAWVEQEKTSAGMVKTLGFIGTRIENGQLCTEIIRFGTQLRHRQG